MINFVGMRDFINFFENNSIFPHDLYWWVPDIYHTTFFEIYFKPKNWQKWNIRDKSGDKPWSMFDGDSFCTHLFASNVDMGILSTYLQQSILEEAILADMVTKRIVNFLGKDVVDAALSDHEKFTSELISIVSNITGFKPQTKTKLRLIKE